MEPSGVFFIKPNNPSAVQTKIISITFDNLGTLNKEITLRFVMGIINQRCA
jgi:hypothetical protein